MTIFLLLVPVAGAFDIVGHRGARGLAPENTLVGFMAAPRLGANVVELDITLTRDERVIVRHDARVSRELCRGPYQGRRYRSLTLRQVKRLDCGTRRAHDRFARTQTPAPGAHVPLLDQVYRVVPRRTRLLVEAKTDPRRPRDFSPTVVARRLIAVIRRAGGVRRTTVQSFDWRVLREVQRMAPRLRLQALASDDTVYPGSPWLAGFNVPDIPMTGAVADTAKRAGFDALAVAARYASPALLARAHANGLTLQVYTVDNPQRMLDIIRLGVDGVISNFPDRLAEQYAAR